MILPSLAVLSHRMIGVRAPPDLPPCPRPLARSRRSGMGGHRRDGLEALLPGIQVRYLDHRANRVVRRGAQVNGDSHHR